MNNSYKQLVDYFGKEKISQNEPLSKHTTFRLGGPADIFFRSEGTLDLIRAVVACRKLGVKFVVLGGGSNVIAGDKGFRGMVISNRKGVIERIDDKRIEVTSGTLNTTLVKYLMKHELTGLEFIAGIPGSIGGAIRSNARFRKPSSFQDHVKNFFLVNNQFIVDFLEEVLILTQNSIIRWVDKEYINPQYHKTHFKESDDIILSGRFKLDQGNKDYICNLVRDHLLWRKSRSSCDEQRHIQMPADPITGHNPRQPNMPSPGCIFSNVLNTDNHPAGRMIDLCGLKGKRIGNIMIANEHANYMVNLGKGKASEALALISMCQENVQKRFNVNLELEVDLIGEF